MILLITLIFIVLVLIAERLYYWYWRKPIGQQVTEEDIEQATRQTMSDIAASTRRAEEQARRAAQRSSW